MSFSHPPRLKVLSFGFKYGLPRANYYFDVSFSPNPARQEPWDLASSPDPEMAAFVLSQPDVARFLELTVPLIQHVATLDGYQVAAFGCSSGRHRSPIIANEVASRLIDEVQVTLEHRDLPEGDAFLYDLSFVSRRLESTNARARKQ